MMRTTLCTLALLAVSALRADTGNPNLKSIEALTFGPNGLLVIGDGKGAQIVTIDTGDVSPTSWTKTEILDIQGHLGAKLGTDAKGISIIKMTVNPASQRAYVAIKHLATKKDMIVIIEGNGDVRELNLEKVNFQAYPIAGKDKAAVTRIADVAVAGDRILAAGQASEVFSSKVFSIVLKPSIVPIAFSTETFHIAHKNWDTKAPIFTVIPYESKGKQYIVGAFTCTPIVKFGLDEMKAGGQVKGESIIEIGSGNRPRDMFTYEKGGKKYILMSMERFHHAKNPVGSSPFWACKVDHDLLEETTNVNDKALWRVKGDAKKGLTDRAVPAEAYFGVVHMDRLNTEKALVLRNGDKEVLNLKVLDLP